MFPSPAVAATWTLLIRLSNIEHKRLASLSMLQEYQSDFSMARFEVD